MKKNAKWRSGRRIDRAGHLRRLRLEALEERLALSILYVDNRAAGLGNGTSWDNAHTDLQTALAAAVAGDVVRVAQGTYRPTATTDRSVSFQLKSGVSILGGYAGSGSPSPDVRDITAYPTVLSGDIGTMGDAADNSFHVVVGSGTDSTAILEGVTITAGNAEGESSNACGGGMYTSEGDPKLTNCTFIANLARVFGGGMYNGSSSPILINCRFTANSSGHGGGMYNDSSSSPTLSNCTFTANSATQPHGNGGGMHISSSSPMLTNCTFIGNSAGYGGGIYGFWSSPILVNCMFIGNSAEHSYGQGGGMYNNSSVPTLTNCTFSRNSARVGGGMYSGSPTLTNCTFTRNSAAAGGGIYSASPTLTHCTFTANLASYDGGGLYITASPRLTYCTFTANMAVSGGGIYSFRSDPRLTHCEFNGNTADTAGGGMYSQESSPVLTECTFAFNLAASVSGCGGGIYHTDSTVALTNCTFLANQASSSGGGLYATADSTWPPPDSTLTNCAFIANWAGDSGGGVYYTQSARSIMNHCTLVGNWAARFGGALCTLYRPLTRLTNCIVWGNWAAANSQISGEQVDIIYCDLQGVGSGTGNINLDPQFVRNPSAGSDGTWGTGDDDYGDLRLRPTSPCIDAGDNSVINPSFVTDLAGNPRFVDVPAIANTGNGTAPIIDMGAYESPNPMFVLGGTDGNDDFSLGLTGDQASVQIGTPARSYTYAVSAIASLAIIGGAGDDRFTVDFTNGNPVPEAGAAYDGQDGTDTLHIAAPGSNATLTGTQMIVGTAAPIVFHSAEGISLDLGDGRLTKSGSGAVALTGSNRYSGGTEVLEGTLVVGHAEGLPAGGALTIGHGGTVVLAAGLSAASAVCSSTQDWNLPPLNEMPILAAPTPERQIGDAERAAIPTGTTGIPAASAEPTARAAAPSSARTDPSTIRALTHPPASPSVAIELPMREITWLNIAGRIAPRKRIPLVAMRAAVDFVLAGGW